MMSRVLSRTVLAGARAMARKGTTAFFRVSSPAAAAPPCCGPELSGLVLQAPGNARRISRSVIAAASRGQDMQVNAAHILFTGPDAAKTADDILSQIKGGTLKFEDAAATHSECPSRANGGSLGWFGRGAMVPEFEQAAFETDIGGYATCTTQFGTHIVRVDGERVLPQVKQMSVNELKELLDNPAEAEECQLVDVREPGEVEAASLSAFSVYSLSLSNKWGQEFFETMDPAKKTVIMCHHGGRSMSMAQFLLDQGFQDVHNVVGGINAYSDIDPSVPKY